MKKTLVTLLLAGLLGMICSCSKAPPSAANSTPDPKVPERVKKQQDAIAKASQNLQKEQAAKAKETGGTPSPTP